MLFSRLLPIASFLLASVTAQQSPLQVDCENDLDVYINALLTVLHNAGYTSFETALATLSETQAGYDLLDALSRATNDGDHEYLFVPTNDAFSAAGLNATSLDPVAVYDLVAYHLVSSPSGKDGKGIVEDLSSTPSNHVVVSSYLDVEAGSTEKIVLDKNGKVLLTAGSVDVVGHPIDVSSRAEELKGLWLYEVNNVSS
jgi:hypothetical protein